MKQQYIHPNTMVQTIHPLSIICTSSSPSGAPRITGIVSGGENSGDVSTAF